MIRFQYTVVGPSRRRRISPRPREHHWPGRSLRGRRGLPSPGILDDKRVAERRDRPRKVANHVEAPVDEARLRIKLVDIAILPSRLVDLDREWHQIAGLENQLHF